MKVRLWVVAAALCAAAGIANAQDVEGPGYRLSEGTVFHPSVGVETGFVSNVFFEESSQDPKSSAIMRVLAKFAIASQPAEGRAAGAASDSELGPSDGVGGAEKMSFRASLGLRYEEFLNSRQTVRDQRNLGATAELDLGFLPRSAVSFLVNDTLVRDTRPANFETSQELVRDVNRLRLGLRWRPPGRTLWGLLAYENTIDVFEDEDLAFADRMQQTIRLQANWQYLPVTRFYLDASQGFYGGLGSDSAKVGSFPLRIVGGAASALTELTTTRLHFGWAVGFYEEGTSYSGPVYGADVGYRYNPRGRVVVGFDRTFADSINANYYADYKVMARLEQQISVILARAEVSYRHRTYGGAPPPGVMPVDPNAARADDILALGVDLSYYYRDWLAVVAQYSLASVSTDYRVQVTGSTGTRIDDPGYQRQQALVGVHAAF